MHTISVSHHDRPAAGAVGYDAGAASRPGRLWPCAMGPGERFNLWEVSLDMGWVYRPVFEQVGRFQQSVAKYPNIKTGEDFKGYQ